MKTTLHGRRSLDRRPFSWHGHHAFQGLVARVVLPGAARDGTAPGGGGSWRAFVAACLVAVAGIALTATAQAPDADIPPPAEVGPAPDQAALTNMVIRPVAPGVFEVGLARLDRRERSVTFPGLLNMRHGLVEYFLVTRYGRTHESVLRTDAEPYHIHIAMLLLDAKGDPAASATKAGRTEAEVPSGQVVNPWTQPIRGDPVDILVSWTNNGVKVERRAEDLVYNTATQSAMSPGSWTYNGSLIHKGVFRAQLQGLIASVIADPTALINNPRVGRENDEIWLVNSNAVPAMNTPVQVTLKLEQGRGSAP